MLESPFQAIVMRADSDFINRDLLKEVYMETLTSPVISTKKPAKADTPPSKPLPVMNKVLPLEEPSDFSPKYIFNNDVSTIKELKKLIQEEKKVKVSFIIDGDMSKITTDDRLKLEKINSFDANKAIEGIKNSNCDIPQLQEDKGGECRYKIVTLEEKTPLKEEKSANKYLSANEIINEHRKVSEAKKARTAAFSSSMDENKTAGELAQFYYKSDINEYKSKGG